MTRNRKPSIYESPMPDEELSSRMASSAGRKLEARLAETADGRRLASDPDDDQIEQTG